MKKYHYCYQYNNPPKSNHNKDNKIKNSPYRNNKKKFKNPNHLKLKVNNISK